MENLTVKDQVRSEFGNIEELAKSIREHGVQSPIHVRKNGDDGYIILTGERRFRAAKMIGLETIPAIIKVVESEEKITALQLIENMQREDLNVFETVRGFDALRNIGKNNSEIASALGVSRGQISKGLTVRDSFTDEQLAKMIEFGHSPSLKELYRIAKMKPGKTKSTSIAKLTSPPQVVEEPPSLHR